MVLTYIVEDLKEELDTHGEQWYSLWLRHMSSNEILGRELPPFDASSGIKVRSQEKVD